MIEQLLLSKRLFQEGERFSQENNPISAGLAISLFQDCIEILIWSIIKNFSINDVRDAEPFTSLLDKVHKTLENQSIKLPAKAKIIELNKARVNFKHYGNLPDVSEAKKFRDYTESYLRQAFSLCFHKDFDNISMSDLIKSDDVRQFIKEAEKHFINQDYQACINEIAKAKTLLFNSIKIYIPDVDSNLKKASSLFDRQVTSQAASVFTYIHDYLRMLRTMSIINACGVSMKEFKIFESKLPSATLFGDGNFQITRTGIHNNTEEEAKVLLRFMIDLALKAQTLV
jgi:hypothetical protein